MKKLILIIFILLDGCAQPDPNERLSISNLPDWREPYLLQVTDSKKNYLVATKLVERFRAVDSELNENRKNQVLFMKRSFEVCAHTNAENHEISTGMIYRLESPDEFMALLAHNLAHFRLEHVEGRANKLGGYDANYNELIGEACGSFDILPYTIFEEKEVDEFARNYLEKAGFDLPAYDDIFHNKDDFGKRFNSLHRIGEYER